MTKKFSFSRPTLQPPFLTIINSIFSRGLLHQNLRIYFIALSFLLFTPKHVAGSFSIFFIFTLVFFIFVIFFQILPLILKKDFTSLILFVNKKIKFTSLLRFSLMLTIFRFFFHSFILSFFTLHWPLALSQFLALALPTFLEWLVRCQSFSLLIAQQIIPKHPLLQAYLAEASVRPSSFLHSFHFPCFIPSSFLFSFKKSKPKH